MNAILQVLMTLPVPAVVLFKMTILLGLGWILHFALIRSNPRWRALLWRMVMVCVVLLVPAQLFLPELPLFVINKAQRISAPANPVPAPLPAAPLEVQTPAEPLLQPNNILPPIPQKPQISIAAFLESLARNWTALLAVAWAALTLILSIRHLYTYGRLSRFIKSANPAPERILATARHVASQLERVELPRLRVAEDLASPFAAGFLHPVIVIPKTLADEKYRPNLVAVLAHELVHIKSRDLFWMAFAHALSILLWFHPLMWRMRHAHNMACEQVCDGVAAEISGGAPAYSQTLAQTFLTLVVDAPQPMGAPMLRPSEIMRRIAILKIGLQVKSLRRSWVGLACLAAIIVLAGLGRLRLVQAKESGPPETILTTSHVSQTEPSEHSSDATEQNASAAGLIKAMRDSNVRVSYPANEALLKIGPINIDVIRAFIQSVRDHADSFDPNGSYDGPSGNIVPVSNKFFSLLGPEHKYAIPDLVALARDSHPGVQRVAVEALTNIGEIPEELMPMLMARLRKDQSPWAVRALELLGPKAAPLTPQLIEMLRQKGFGDQVAAARVLAAIGRPVASPAIPVLEELVKQSDDTMGSLSQNLLKLDPGNPTARQRIEQIANDPKTYPRDALYANALLFKQNYNRQEHKAYDTGANLQALLKGIGSSDEEQSAQAARLILEYTWDTPARKKAVERAFQIVDGNSTNLQARSIAAEGFRSLGLGEREFLPRLISLIERLQKSEKPRYEIYPAVAGLAKLGPDTANQVLPLLRQLQQSDDPRLRKEANRALAERIERGIQRNDLDNLEIKKIVAIAQKFLQENPSSDKYEKNPNRVIEYPNNWYVSFKLAPLPSGELIAVKPDHCEIVIDKKTLQARWIPLA